VPTLGKVVTALEKLYDPAWAEPWDAVGLVCGDPEAPVRRVLLAIDPVAATVEESVALGADLLLTHHPLFLRGMHSVATDTYKGRLLHQLITAGVALYTAHTNADVAAPGVSDALAARLGLLDTRPLAARPAEPLDKVVTFVPHDAVEPVVDALASAGAGAVGDYSRCAWLATGTGTFLPGAGASPAVGRPGVVERVPETRIEMVLARHLRVPVVRALRAAHPYQEPAYDVLELAPVPNGRGFGRIGELSQPLTARALLAKAAEMLPATASGVRATGDPERVIRTVAVAGGAGDSHLADAARAGADAYLTADLRHHPVSEHTEAAGPALVSAAHWATEHPWLYDAAARLRARLDDTVETVVSQLVTDPWSLHLPSVKEPSSAP